MGWGGGWGNHAPETARTVAKAFYEGKARVRGNCRTDGDTYYLENSSIARRIKPDDIPIYVAKKIEGYTTVRRPLEFSFNGWPTKMTARHLSALGIKAEVIGIKEPKCYLNGKPCDPRKWYTKEEIEMLPKEVPKVPRVRRAPERYVELTLPLFA